VSTTPSASIVRATTLSPIDAVALSRTLRDRAASEGRVLAAGAIVTGPALLVGARQRAARVVDRASFERSAIPLVRRDTTGTHVFIAPTGAALFALALPTRTALVPDTRGPTTLNRNVRGWLQGLTRQGALAHYFGREWLTIHKRPAGVLALSGGLDQSLLIELWIGLEAPLALPESLASEHERTLDRWLGKRPASFREVCPDKPLDHAHIDAIQARSLERYGIVADLVPDTAIDPPRHLHSTSALWDDELERTPRRWIEPTRCAIGWIDAAVLDDGDLWIGGDVLVDQPAIEAITAALHRAEPERSSLLDEALEAHAALGADAREWQSCGAALDAVVRSRP
jgi:hypothetical protein